MRTSLVLHDTNDSSEVCTTVLDGPHRIGLAVCCLLLNTRQQADFAKFIVLASLFSLFAVGGTLILYLVSLANVYYSCLSDISFSEMSSHLLASLARDNGRPCAPTSIPTSYVHYTAVTTIHSDDVNSFPSSFPTSSSHSVDC